MDNFGLSLVDNGHVLLMDVFLIDYRLDMLMDHWSVMLMHNVSVKFIGHVLMMLVDDFLVSVLDNGLFYYGLHDRSFGVRDHSGLGNI